MAARLTDLMNRRVFAYAGAPLKNIEISIDRDRIRQAADAAIIRLFRSGGEALLAVIPLDALYAILEER